MKRTATAIWEGSGKEGKGQLSTQSKILENAPYSYVSRFEQGPGTNPEELIAAAHAGCFSMKLSFVLGAAGFTPEKLQTQCEVDLENGAIITSQLTLAATVPGVSEEEFAKAVKEAKETCPVSKSLNSAISVQYTLNK